MHPPPESTIAKHSCIASHRIASHRMPSAQGDVAIIRLLLKAHSKLLELTSGADHRPRDPRRIPDGYGKTAYTIAFDLGRCGSGRGGVEGRRARVRVTCRC